MLSEEEKARIRAEEETRAKQKLEQQEERQKARAALEFRESVKVELNPKRAYQWWIGVLVLVLATAAGAGWWITRPKLPEISSAPIQGGIEDGELLSKCQTEVQNRLGFSSRAEFGLDGDAASQVFVSADGKTWDSWVRYQDPKIGLMRRNFSCSFTTADCVFNVRFLDKE
jgi:hypothetical protein